MATRVPGGTGALARHRVTFASIQTQTAVQAARPIEGGSTALITLGSRPARGTGADSCDRVAALRVQGITCTHHVAPVPVELVVTFSLAAAFTGETVRTQTSPIDVRAPGLVQAVASVSAVQAVPALRALLLTPVPGVAGRTPTLSADTVTLPSVVTQAPVAAVVSEGSLWAGQGTDRAHPARWTETSLFSCGTHASILTGTLGTTISFARPLTECSSSAGCTPTPPRGRVTARPVLTLARPLTQQSVGPRRTGVFTAGTQIPRGAGTAARAGVTDPPVLAPTVCTGPAPGLQGAVAGAVRPPPSRLALATIGSHTPAVDTLLTALGHTDTPALVVTLATVRAFPVVSLYPRPVRRTVGDRVPGATIVAPGVIAVLLRHLVVGNHVLLHPGNRIALPAAAHVVVIGHQGAGGWEQEVAQNEGAHQHHLHHLGMEDKVGSETKV